jgi:thioredoxin-dependent peroxiredoxin
MLKIGDKVPELSASLHDGGEFSTVKLSGRPYVIYFYPKDFTPGCSKEACSFRDRRTDITAAGAALFGVSLDGPETHKAFAELHELNFPLISDTDRKVSNAFGVVWMWGILPIARRVTFVVDGGGVVRNVIASEFNISRHVDEAIAILKSVR